MKTIPVLVLLGAAVCLGLFLGTQYLRQVRSRPAMIGLHLLLGAGGFEVLVMLLSGAPDGTVLAAGGQGRIAAGLLLLALFTGLTAPMVGRRSRPTMSAALATHAAAALAGFALLVVSLART